jgi:hypothetical protein
MLVNFVPAAMDFSTAVRPRPRAEKKAAPVAPDAIDPVTRTQISLEYASLQYRDHCPLGRWPCPDKDDPTHGPAGMYVVPSPETLMVWDAVFFVHQGRVGAIYMLRCANSPTRVLCRRHPQVPSDVPE